MKYMTKRRSNNHVDKKDEANYKQFLSFFSEKNVWTTDSNGGYNDRLDMIIDIDTSE